MLESEGSNSYPAKNENENARNKYWFLDYQNEKLGIVVEKLEKIACMHLAVPWGTLIVQSD